MDPHGPGSGGPRLRLVGAFAVVGDGGPADLGSRKARLLVKLLAVERGGPVSVDRIGEVLWGDRPPRDPAANIATLVSRVRAVLGGQAITGNRDGYRLGLLRVDLDDAAGLLAEAQRRTQAGEPGLAYAAAARAAAILGAGDVLADEPDAAWAQPCRVEAAALVRRARHAAAEGAIGVGEAAVALEFAQAAAYADGYDEAAYRLLMRAQVALGSPAAALAAYAALRDRLADDLGTEPAAQTRALHLDILREQESDAHAPPAAAPTGPPAAVLAGRGTEAAALTAAWTAAVAGRPGLVLLAGQAGMGKTRLAAYAAELALSTGGTALTVRCHETERSLFLQPLVEAIGGWAARLAPGALAELAGDRAAVLAGLVPQVAAVLGAPPEPALVSDDLRRRHAYEAVGGFLARLGGRAPTVLVLDDLQQAGLATIEALHYLARHVSLARLLVVGTVRTGEGEQVTQALGDVAETVHVGPLPAAAVAELAAAAGQAPLAEHIARRTNGHALFVVESLRALAAGEAGVPESLQAAVLARVARTGPQTEEVLRAAAVLGASVPPELVGRLLNLPVPDAARHCERALAAGLLAVADRTYEFANDLIREVLYASTPLPTRTAWHRLAADRLGHRPEAMAQHAAAAGDHRRAARAWLLAGEQAVRRLATADAAVLFGRAVDAARALGDDELLGRSLVARGTAREALADYPSAMVDLEDAVVAARAAGDRRLEMRTLLAAAGDVPVALGRPAAESCERLDAARRLAAGLGDHAMEARLLGRLAIIAANGLRFTDAIAFGRRAVECGHAGGERRSLAAALDGLKAAYAYLGDVAALEGVLAELLPLLRAQGDLWRLQWAVFESAFPPIAAGEYDVALRRIEESIELNRRTGYTAYEGWFVAHLGWVHGLAGDDTAALREGRRAMAATSRSPHVWWRASACALHAAALARTGDREAAVAVLTEGRRHRQPGGELHVLRCLGPLAELTGSPEILAEADTLLSRVDTPSGYAWMIGADVHLSIARAWLAAGDPDRARAVLAPLLAATAQPGWAAVRAEALRAARPPSPLPA
ncbi:AAA family ATPase [Catellatospora sp. NPDC049609]|uniref:ATP-binding protein n=1 Tax=Catellatospora sp. NPDC049609 TaxID=3155505 RepID=UPI003443FA67